LSLLSDPRAELKFYKILFWLTLANSVAAINALQSSKRQLKCERIRQAQLIRYVGEMLVKHDVEPDEFDLIALMQLGVEVKVEEG